MPQTPEEQALLAGAHRGAQDWAHAVLLVRLVRRAPATDAGLVGAPDSRRHDRCESARQARRRS